VELTELSAFGGTFWTLGFEAFGPAESREAALPAAIEGVLRGQPANVVLGLERSSAYPAWIAAAGRLGGAGPT
jgi:hypothetical protein